MDEQKEKKKTEKPEQMRKKGRKTKKQRHEDEDDEGEEKHKVKKVIRFWFDRGARTFSESSHSSLPVLRKKKRPPFPRSTRMPPSPPPLHQSRSRPPTKLPYAFVCTFDGGLSFDETRRDETRRLTASREKTSKRWTISVAKREKQQSFLGIEELENARNSKSKDKEIDKPTTV